MRYAKTALWLKTIDEATSSYANMRLSQQFLLKEESWEYNEDEHERDCKWFSSPETKENRGNNDVTHPS
jgi:hypothetical protein